MQRILFILAFLAFALAASAQSNGSAAKGGPDTADEQWQKLKNKGQPIEVAPANPDDPSSVASARATEISDYIADADALNDFYAKNPGHAAAKEAQRLEALDLLYAESLGDTTQKGRCKQLVAQLRKDPGIDIEHREQLAAFSDNLDVTTQHPATADQELLAFEQTARALQTEFPGSESVYDSLIGIAQSSADDHAALVAKDVLGMPAPDTYKAKAQILLNRLALKGTSVADLSNATLGSDNPVQGAIGKPVVIYSWSVRSPISIAIAKQIAAKAPVDTAFIGVCVDIGDPGVAQNAAVTSQAPGAQVLDPMGYMGKFAGRALITSPGLIYVADRKGTIVSVSGHRDARAVLSSLSSL